MASVNTNNTVLELSRSANNAKDVSNDNNEDNNAKSKEREDTNDIAEKKSKDSAKETMTSVIALMHNTGGRKTLLATGTHKVMTMLRTIPIVETKMKNWTRLRMTT